MRSNGDDVVIIVELASLSTEAEVSDGRDLEVGDLEALGPFVFGLVLELEAEEFVLVVGEAGDGGDLGVADAAGLACTISYVLISWWRREVECESWGHTEHPATSLALPSLSLS